MRNPQGRLDWKYTPWGMKLRHHCDQRRIRRLRYKLSLISGADVRAFKRALREGNAYMASQQRLKHALREGNAYMGGQQRVSA